MYIIDMVEYAFAEATIFGFIIGLVFFLLGLFIIVATTHTILVGKRVPGKVVGAVKDVWIKEKNRDGKIVKKRRETLFAIFEYIRPDGLLHQEKASSGGSGVLKYKTGQEVNLIIVPSGKYDDVYDADDYSVIIIGIILLAIGFGIMLWAANAYASLGVGVLTLISVVGVFIFRILTGRKKKQKKHGESKHVKAFDPAEVRPIEEFV